MFSHNILMCRPDYFDVVYEINPWMKKEVRPDKTIALQQWTTLHHYIIRLGGFVNYIPPEPNLPDMVFTANGGLVHDNRVAIPRFANPERQQETIHFRHHFRKNGLQILDFEEDEYFEGNGDAFIFNGTLFVGSGSRSVAKVGWKLVKFFGLRKMVICDLVDLDFYHLDTCFCPLSDNDVLLYPKAFSAETLQAFSTEKLNFIEVSEEDARRFACNSVVLGKHVIMPHGSPEAFKKLTGRGYTPHVVEMSEFMKAGGAAKCLTLRV